MQSRQRTADKAIRDQVQKIEDQRVVRECRFENRLDKVVNEAADVRKEKEEVAIVDRDLLQRQRKISQIREKYNLRGNSIN